MSRSVRITAPSRLHFGLLRFASAEGPSYGGLGMMIDRPGLELELSLSETWQCNGPGGERALAFARQAAGSLATQIGQPVKVTVHRIPQPHTGLGTGTQLALAVACGVDVLLGEGSSTLQKLVAAVGRGQRGAVGSYGFKQGGLIWEEGKLPCEALGRLQRRVAVPDSWRVVLITPDEDQGLSGENEQAAFRELPPVPERVTEELMRIAVEEIIPAAEHGDFARFSAASYEYGILAGNCFAAAQGGPFASPRIARCVALIRDLGTTGVGQSSWGPTLFAFTENQTAAETLLKQLQSYEQLQGAKLQIVRPDNRGATVEEQPTSLEQPVSHQSLSE